MFKSTTAHLFHIGDSRIYRLRGNLFACLTKDHSCRVYSCKFMLTKALGIEKLDDYRVLEVLQSSTRSHLYLVKDEQEDGPPYVLKVHSDYFSDEPQTCNENPTLFWQLINLLLLGINLIQLYFFLN